MRLHSIEEAGRLLGKGTGYVLKLIEQGKLTTVTWKNHVLVVANDEWGEAA